MSPIRRIEEAKERCIAVANRVQSLPLSKVTDSCKQTLLRLVNSELNFLSRLSSASPDFSGPISANIGYLESVVHILQQTFVTGVSRVCKPIPLSSENEERKCSSKGIHVDIVCTVDRRPVWFIVSDRNPKYISWLGSHKNKGLRARVEKVLSAAQSCLMLKPFSVILFFSNGLDDVVTQKLLNEFGASQFGKEFSEFDCDFSKDLEYEWVNDFSRSYRRAIIFQLKVEHYSTSSESSQGCTCPLLGAVTPDWADKQSQLTLALIALVSGISNGGTGKLLATPVCEMMKRFKSNYEFVMAQVMSELQNPILVELGGLISGKRGMICESVHSEFKELVSMCGGHNEKLRAEYLLKCLLIVPDSPSERVMSLPTTRKIALKNKVIFGTGDYWHAPTLTANMGFVRAISQTGMSLSTIEHRPRALTGD
ncbi:PREDICTED: uncharacterized protein LOC104610845 isoform X2 [Nelumbo nucifera]|uniref:DUF1308 domain-containing protein n=2 Tax=Nelumbo nucifera TaxID=4432 RepID=A0A822YN44_NELNU|nr:PREDICTED: uncharacterized protein LOC104610845 isoform X2 [Nelumbo nucifera]DAD33952.1 TPA_asm: hypothetical protein HUJ06_012803 [Nelumbo nucifera]